MKRLEIQLSGLRWGFEMTSKLSRACRSFYIDPVKHSYTRSTPVPHRGEMVLNVGGSLYFYNKGADGVIDISPFTCMNGIVSEAVYPRVIRDHDNFPIRSFYFDGTEGDLERDVDIFLELATTYSSSKKIERIYPPHFN